MGNNRTEELGDTELDDVQGGVKIERVSSTVKVNSSGGSLASGELNTIVSATADSITSGQTGTNSGGSEGGEENTAAQKD